MHTIYPRNILINRYAWDYYDATRWCDALVGEGASFMLTSYSASKILGLSSQYQRRSPPSEPSRRIENGIRLPDWMYASFGPAKPRWGGSVKVRYTRNDRLYFDLGDYLLVEHPDVSMGLFLQDLGLVDKYFRIKLSKEPLCEKSNAP